MKSALQQLGRTSAGKRVLKSRRVTRSRFLQALGYSLINNQVVRAGSEVPIALTLRVDTGARLEPGEPLFYRRLRGPVRADPLRIKKVDHVVLWRTNHDQLVTGWANWLSGKVFDSGPTVCLLDEFNRNRQAIRSTLWCVSHLRAAPTSYDFADQRNLVVVLNPASPLPLVVSRMWALSRTVVIFTKQPAFPVAEIGPVDALLVADGVALPDADELAVPLRATFATREQAGAQLKALISGAVDPISGYFFSIQGDISHLDGRPPGDSTDVVVVMPTGWVSPAAQVQTFRDYLDHLLKEADLVAIHSRFLYTHESLIRSERVDAVLLDLIGKGARLLMLTDSDADAHPESVVA